MPSHLAELLRYDEAGKNHCRSHNLPTFTHFHRGSTLGQSSHHWIPFFLGSENLPANALKNKQLLEDGEIISNQKLGDAHAFGL